VELPQTSIELTAWPQHHKVTDNITTIHQKLLNTGLALMEVLQVDHSNIQCLIS